MQSIKEHNLKANHNLALVQVAVAYLYAIYQRTQSESKSQLSSIVISLAIVCMQSIKEHNLKANHNLILQSRHPDKSVCNLSKNTIWKQITTTRRKGYNCNVCMQSIKEHNLKANHNHLLWVKMFLYLYAIYQRTQSESKSQPMQVHTVTHQVCMQSIKEHNLKANHNQSVSLSILAMSVCNLSKNTIWKQITTIFR